jgi:hypothetical protein
LSTLASRWCAVRDAFGGCGIRIDHVHVTVAIFDERNVASIRGPTTALELIDAGTLIFGFGVIRRVENPPQSRCECREPRDRVSSRA